MKSGDSGIPMDMKRGDYVLSLLKKTRQFPNQEWAATGGKSLSQATDEIEFYLLEGTHGLVSY